MAPPPPLSQLSDQEVVALALQARDEGYTELVRRYEPSVLSVIYLIVRNGEDAKDLAQVTFIKAFKALDRYDPQRNLGAWIRRIAKNTALDEVQLRKQLSTVAIEGLSIYDTNRLKGTALQVPDPNSSTTSAPTSLHRYRFRAALVEAIACLPEKPRRCFIQHDLEERSYKDIAKRLHMRTATVRIYTHRARQQLREILRPQLDYLLPSTPTPA